MLNLCLNNVRGDERLLSYLIDTTLTGKEDRSSQDTLQEFAADALCEYGQGAGRRDYNHCPHFVKTSHAFVLDNRP